MPELNAIAAIAGRDLLKFCRDPGRLIAAVVFPFLMIFLLGGTLQLNLGRSAGFDFIAFTFTGFLGMTLFQSTAQGLSSLMEDRLNDFAQEVFVSPVSRYSIVFGKILGETLVAIMQVIERDHLYDRDQRFAGGVRLSRVAVLDCVRQDPG